MDSRATRHIAFSAESPYQTEPVKPDAIEKLIILFSFILCLAGPAIAGERGTYFALMLAATVCIWRPTCFLFLFLASSGAYFPNPDFGGGTALTPTRLMALLLFIRCLISPGPVGIVMAFHNQSGVLRVFIFGLFASLLLGAAREMARSNLTVVIQMMTTIATYVLLVGLIFEIKSRAKFVVAVSTALLVPVAYYPMIWVGVLEPIKLLGAGEGTEAVRTVRMSAGHSNLSFIAHLIAPLLGLGLYAFMCSRNQLVKYVCLTVAILAFAAALNTGSRVTLVAGGLGVLIAIVAAIKFRGAAGLGIAFYMAIITPFALTLMWGYFDTNFQMMYLRFTSDAVSQQSRIPHWIHTAQYIVMHPIPDYGLYVSQSEIPNAHNTYLEAGVVGGWLGLVSMIAIGVSCLWKSTRDFMHAAGEHQMWAGAVMVLAFCIFCAISFNSILSHKLAWIIIVFLSFRHGFWSRHAHST